LAEKMDNLTMKVIDKDLATDERLTRLAELARLGLTSPLVAVTIDKLYDHEITEAQNKLSELEADLAEFEAQYEMSSDDFSQRFQDGLMGDEMDYVEWSSLVQMANNLRKRLELLTKETLL